MESGTGPKKLRGPRHHLPTVDSHIRLVFRPTFICSPVVHTASNILLLFMTLNVHLPISFFSQNLEKTMSQSSVGFCSQM